MIQRMEASRSRAVGRLTAAFPAASFGRRNRSLSSKEMIAAVLLLGKCQVALVLMLGSYGRVR
jgi:hypothetical protein